MAVLTDNVKKLCPLIGEDINDKIKILKYFESKVLIEEGLIKCIKNTFFSCFIGKKCNIIHT